MDRIGLKNDLLQQILAADRSVVLLRGPAASGKTSAILELYKHSLDGESRPGCLLIGPNSSAVATLRRQCLSASKTGILVTPAITTFASLAERILSAGSKPGKMLSNPQRRLLLRRIVLLLAEDGKLAALGKVSDTPGLIVALDNTIAELKRAAIEPEALARAMPKARGKAADLLRIYRKYQQQLQDEGVYDVEGRIWTLRDCLRQGQDNAPAGLEGVEAIAADGFTDFSPTQLEVLQLLSNRVKKVVITLPFQADGRQRMWHWTARSLGDIRKQFGDKLLEIELAPLGDNFARTFDGLFDFDASEVTPGGAVKVIEAAGIDAEVTAVASQVKQLLQDGAVAGEIAVMARTMQAYREPIERIFATSNIPINQGPQPLIDIPIIRFALLAASLGPEFASADVLTVINSSYFIPSALGDFDSVTVAAAGTLIRQGNVLTGRDAYALAGNRLVRRSSLSATDTEEESGLSVPTWASSRQITQASQMLSALFDLAEAAQSSAGLGELIERLDLQSAATHSGIAEIIARDLRALAALEPVLAQLDTRSANLAEIREALSAASCPPARSASLVEVTDVLTARAGRWKHVFLLGTGQGQFPPKFTEGSLIGESQRTTWSHHGLRLDSRGDLTAREMLLFYLAVTRADETITFSYPRWNSTGRDGAAGSFLLSAADLLGGFDKLRAAGLVETIQPGRLIAPAKQLTSRRDAVIAAIAGRFDKQFDPDGSAISWAQANASEVVDRASSGIWAANRRWSRNACDSFDGRVTSKAVKSILADKFGPEAIFSPSQLNSFGQCPWQFFAHYVLGIDPLEKPERRLEPVSFGIFAHDVLCNTMLDLAGKSGGSVTLTKTPPEQIKAALAKAVEDISAKMTQGSDDISDLWLLQCNQMAELLCEYLLNPPAEMADARSLHFELRFGPSAGADQAEDPSSIDEPLVLETSAGEVRLRGKIDRVDKVSAEAGQGLFVVDYKTGTLPSQADMDAGRNLQIPIYSLAAEKILGTTCIGGAMHGFGGKNPVHFSLVKNARGREAYPKRLAQAVEKIGQFVKAICQGQFDLLPTHDCPPYCPYRQICQFSQPRKQIKSAAAEGGQR